VKATTVNNTNRLATAHDMMVLCYTLSVNQLADRHRLMRQTHTRFKLTFSRGKKQTWQKVVQDARPWST